MPTVHQPTAAAVTLFPEEPPRAEPPARKRRVSRGWLFQGAVVTLLAVALTVIDEDSPATDTLQLVCLLGLLPALLTTGVCMLLDFARACKRERVRGGWVTAGVLTGLCLTGVSTQGTVSLGCGGGPNEVFRGQVYNTSLLLQQYADQHDGRFPAARTWIADLSNEPGYRHGHALEHTTWSKVGQTATLSPAALGLPDATQIAALNNVHLMEALPGGQRPHGAPRRADDYGAVLYDVSPSRDTYVLYAVGRRRGGHAELAGYFTNADTDAALIGPAVPTGV